MLLLFEICIIFVTDHFPQLMYIPSYFRQEDISVISDYIRQYPFGMLASAEADVPWATHIPFLLKE